MQHELSTPPELIYSLLLSFYPLQFIPMPVLYGVFLYMGVSSLKGIQVSLFEDNVPFYSAPSLSHELWSEDKFTPRSRNPLILTEDASVLLLNERPPLAVVSPAVVSCTSYLSPTLSGLLISSSVL